MVVNAVHVYIRDICAQGIGIKPGANYFLIINITIKMLINIPYCGIPFSFWWITDFFKNGRLNSS